MEIPKSWELSFPSLLEAGFQIECHRREVTMGWDGMGWEGAIEQ